MSRFRFCLLLTCVLVLANNVLAEPLIVRDSQGEKRFDAVPERVVALSWAMVENLVELEVPLVGAADVDGYRRWVAQPELPGSVTDVGTRNEPNIERIAALNPDIIVLSNGQETLVDTLSRVAPVVLFNAFSHDHNNAEAAREIFTKLARLFGRESLARHKLAALDEQMAQLQEQLERHFGPDLPPATSLRFNNTSVAWLYGENSLPHHVLTELGLAPALPQPPSQWGITQKPVSALAGIEDGVLLYFKPFDKAEDLFSSPLWNAIPVVKAGRVVAVEPTWTYGGAMSLGYLGENMVDALLTLEPHP